MNKDELDEKQPPLLAGITAIGIIGLFISSLIVFINTDHPPFTLICVLISNIALIWFSWSYLKKCFFNPPIASTSAGREWNTHNIYTPTMIIIISLMISIVLIVLGVMHHVGYTLHHLWNVLELQYDLGILTILFFLLCTIGGSLGMSSYHQRQQLNTLREFDFNSS